MAATTMRKTIQIVFLIAATLAMFIAFTSLTLTQTQTQTHDDKSNVVFMNSVDDQQPHLQLPSKRVSRFLAQTDPKPRNPNAADHCHKDNEVCSDQVLYGKNATCCNNKCMDLSEDRHNCGACKNQCKYTESCCKGKCVNLYYDSRFCGSCYNKCKPGGYCVYGMCDYA